MAYTRSITRKLYKIVKGKLVKVGGAAVAAAVEKRVRKGAPTRTRTKKHKVEPWRPKFQHGPNRRFLSVRTRPVSAWPKGVNRKFKAKVDKAVTASGLWGEYRYTSQLSIQQTVHDQYAVQFASEVSPGFMPLFMFTPAQLLDAYSVCWNNKLMAQNWTTATNNVGVTQKLSVVNSWSNWFFKSTSQHVVNLEMYVFTAKCDQDKSDGTEQAQYHIAASYADFKGNFRYGGNATVTLDPTKIGSTAADWIEIYKYFYVKKHVVKLLPGQSSSICVQGPKNKDYDLSTMSANGTLKNMVKGLSKQVYFRIINDVTVSANATQGKVAAWQSNQQGGVACRFTTHYRLRPQVGLPATNGNVVCSFFDGPTLDGQVDQQVEEMNPVSIIGAGAD